MGMKISVRGVARQKAGSGERVKKKLGSEGLAEKVAAESSRKAGRPRTCVGARI